MIYINYFKNTNLLEIKEEHNKIILIIKIDYYYNCLIQIKVVILQIKTKA